MLKLYPNYRIELHLLVEFRDNDSIKLDLKNNFPFTAFSTSTLGSSLGYSYNFVFSNYWYANGTFAIGFGINQFNADTLHIDSSSVLSTGSINKSNVGTIVLIRLSFGYERNNFIVGLNYIGNVRGINYNNYDINPFSANVRFFVAKRFGRKSS